MIDYNKEVANALEKVLPTYYEMTIYSGLKTPCISYQEINNSSVVNGDTKGYSRISFRVKVWDNSLKVLEDNAIKIDKVMRTLGFKRVSSGELFDRQSTMIQKIMTYECLALENY